jgi:RNA polymerase sigma factor (sigma-70 family)
MSDEVTPEDFIRDNPFPENGTEINNQLVKEIQDSNKASEKRKNLELLLKNNARLVYLVYHQYNYNQELGSIMSFVYEGLAKATDTFDPKVGMPFYHYAVQTIRGLLQNWYNYNNDLIHIPVMKKKEVTYDYSDINDYIEHQHCDDAASAFIQIDDNDFSYELDQIIEEFVARNKDNARAMEDLEMFQLYRKHTLKEISTKTGLNTVKIRKMIDRTIERLTRFNSKLNDGTLFEL